MHRQWNIHARVEPELVARFPELPPLLVQLLANRGLTSQEAVDEFLHPDYGEDLHDPFTFRHMDRAVTRLLEAIKGGESIILYGDYDADGVCAVTLLAQTLRALGHETFATYIPDRYSEGYGLNLPAIEQFGADGTKLLIACDCGTTNVAEITRAKEVGMDVIVVDHHKEPAELPPALAFINPTLEGERYPFARLCATGVAFKLATALLVSANYGEGMLETPLPDGWEKWLLDLVAIATIADMVPLLGENRTLVTHGLRVLAKTKRFGLVELSRLMGTPLTQVTTQVVSFQIAPRINAAGRMRHAKVAYELLSAPDRERAAQLAGELHATNVERQKLTAQLVAEAEAQVPTEPPQLLVIRGEGWSAGVIGLVAGKLKERFFRPTLVIGMEGDKLVGSGRSVPGFDITNALTEASAHLSHFGGHPMACGFTLTSAAALEPFVAQMQTIAERELAKTVLLPELTVDAELKLVDITWENAATIERCAPFGIGCPNPVFVTKSVMISGLQRVGADGKHLKLRVVDDRRTTLPVIGFRMGERAEELTLGQSIDIAYELSVNEWNGNRELQLSLVDLRGSNEAPQ